MLFRSDDRQNYICALECNSVHPCERSGYYCSNDVLGICLPSCREDSDCNTGSVCNDENKCEKIPGHIGGSCGNDDECDGEYTTCNTWFSGGYCTQECFDNDDSDCPDNSKCVTAGRRQTTSCLASCASDKDCRTGEGYLCHPQMGTKSGVCYRKCREDSDCNDEDAICNEDGYCAPENWKGWSESEEEEKEPEEIVGNNDEETSDTYYETGVEDSSDEEVVADDDGISGESEEGEEQADGDGSRTENKKKSGGCSLILM